RAEEAEGKGHEDSNSGEPSDSLRLVAPSMLVMPVDPADRDGHNTLLAVQDIACTLLFFRRQCCSGSPTTYWTTNTSQYPISLDITPDIATEYCTLGHIKTTGCEEDSPCS